jgi:hypothetical protein
MNITKVMYQWKETNMGIALSNLLMKIRIDKNNNKRMAYQEVAGTTIMLSTPLPLEVAIENYSLM